MLNPNFNSQLLVFNVDVNLLYLLCDQIILRMKTVPRVELFQVF